MNRIKALHQTDISCKKIVYLMTKSFRIMNNYTLYEAEEKAKEHFAFLSVYIVTPKEENPRNTAFFRSHTDDLDEALRQMVDVAEHIERESIFDVLIDASDVYLDKAYLKEDIALRDRILAYCITQGIRLYEVESNVFQPVEMVSQKEEYSARTIRDKIWKYLIQPLVLMNRMISSGERKALNILSIFIDHKLEHYDQRNDPSNHYVSGLSAYLKYGLISPNVIYEMVQQSKKPHADEFIEELVVRRELAYNFVFYNKDYDQFDKMTYEWAYQTMGVHLFDERKYLYDIEDYIHFRTHDPYFNAAMKEMIHFGRMHSYMRMYWCKKIIEWSPSYEEAYRIALYLNNYYFLDGNTPNGYAGIAWCFGKHDRAWTERPIFGKLRYMNANGLKRKFNIDLYVDQVDRETQGGM